MTVPANQYFMRGAITATFTCRVGGYLDLTFWQGIHKSPIGSQQNGEDAETGEKYQMPKLKTRKNSPIFVAT